MNKKKFYKIVVWCKEADLFTKDGEQTQWTRKPCQNNYYEYPPCGYKLCEPMQNYLRDHSK